MATTTHKIKNVTVTGFKAGQGKVQMTLDIEIETLPNGKVWSMSHWEHCHELARLGILKKESTKVIGCGWHDDFFLN